MSDIFKRRLTFNETAEVYNEVRPHYPATLFRNIADATRLKPGAKVVEIGPGTGQATRPLAELGYDITAVELGADLANVARRELVNFPNVAVLSGSFEDAALANNSFELVFAATAIHWIAPEKRFAKPHALLKPDGFFAVVETHHASDEKGDHFFHASQPIYEKYYAGSDSAKPTLPVSEKIKPFEFDASLFRQIHFQRYPVVLTYTAPEYAKLLSTYSPTLELAPKDRAGFLRDIESLIRTQLDGNVAKQYVFTLTIARKI